MPTNANTKSAKLSTNQNIAVLFDLDGTLIDTAPDFIVAVNQQRSNHGLAALPDDLIRNTVSNGARALIELSFSFQEGDPDFAQKHQELLALYLRHIADKSTLFPGMDELLSWLEFEDIPWGIVTNKPRRFTIPLLEGLALNQRCKVVVCPDDVANSKPHPESLLSACSALNKNPKQSLYIGDHQRDIEAGRRAGMTTIAVGYGYIPRSENIEAWQADYISANVAELHSRLNEILGISANTFAKHV